MDYQMSKEFGVEWVNIPQKRAMELYATMLVINNEQARKNKKSNNPKVNGRH